MPSYLTFPLTDTPDAVTARILDALRLALPGWQPSEGALEVALAEEFGREIADLRTLAADVNTAIVRRLGESVFSVPALQGVYATQFVRFTLTQTGASVPAGFLTLGVNDDGVEVAFATTVDATADATATTVTVLARCTAVGAIGNGVPAGALTVATASNVVVSATAVEVSNGGVDAESDAAYLDRFTTTMATLTRTPILPGDFAVRARDIAGVARALVLDGYDPTGNAGAGSFGNERMLTVIPVDVDGLPVPTATRLAMQTLLDGLREVNFVVQTSTPTYTPIALTFAAIAKAGTDPVAVRAALIARGLQLLNPALYAGGDQSPPVWVATPTLRRNYVLAQLGAVDGVAYLSALTLNGGTGDVSLAGVAGLPAPVDSAHAATVGASASTVTGTVT